MNMFSWIVNPMVQIDGIENSIFFDYAPAGRNPTCGLPSAFSEGCVSGFQCSDPPFVVGGGCDLFDCTSGVECHLFNCGEIPDSLFYCGTNLCFTYAGQCNQTTIKICPPFCSIVCITV